jgi:hypothetical protein
MPLWQGAVKARQIPLIFNLAETFPKPGINLNSPSSAHRQFTVRVTWVKT